MSSTRPSPITISSSRQQIRRASDQASRLTELRARLRHELRRPLSDLVGDPIAIDTQFQNCCAASQTTLAVVELLRISHQTLYRSPAAKLILQNTLHPPNRAPQERLRGLELKKCSKI